LDNLTDEVKPVIIGHKKWGAILDVLVKNYYPTIYKKKAFYIFFVHTQNISIQLIDGLVFIARHVLKIVQKSYRLVHKKTSINCYSID
jgi:hypothetical protein